VGASLLAIGDEEGIIHFFTRNGALLFSQPLIKMLKSSAQSEAHTISGISFSAGPNGCSELFIVSTAGQLIRFSNLATDAIVEGAKKGDMAALKSARAAIKISKSDLSSAHGAVHCMQIAPSANSTALVTSSMACSSPTCVVVGGGGEYGFSVWDTVNTEKGEAVEWRDGIESDMAGKVTKLVVVPDAGTGTDAKWLLVLNAAGTLSWWDLRLLLLLCEFDQHSCRSFAIVDREP
jgi:hypothetical protein